MKRRLIMEVDSAVVDVQRELDSAREKHQQPMHSAHEGFAVLDEERDELWEVVKLNPYKDAGVERAEAARRRTAAMRAEAIQVAAMAIRFVQDVCDRERETW